MMLECYKYNVLVVTSIFWIRLPAFILLRHFEPLYELYYSLDGIYEFCKDSKKQLSWVCADRQELRRLNSTVF